MVHARAGNWDAFRQQLSDILDDAIQAGTISAEVGIESAYVTGSLAYGAGQPGESDVDLVLGISGARSRPAEQNELRQVLDEKSAALAAATNLQVTDAHIVEVTAVDRAPHRAMEYQHYGKQIARETGGEPPEMKIFDVFDERVLDSARQA